MEFICDPYARELDSDPFPIYKRLRDDYPCYWSEPGDCWMLTRYDDVTRAARDWETFSSAQGNMLDDIPARTGVTLGATDPPRRILHVTGCLRDVSKGLYHDTIGMIYIHARSSVYRGESQDDQGSRDK